MYDDLERIAIEQEAEERLKTERLVSACALYVRTQSYDFGYVHVDTGFDGCLRVQPILRRSSTYRLGFHYR